MVSWFAGVNPGTLGKSRYLENEVSHFCFSSVLLENETLTVMVSLDMAAVSFPWMATGWTA